MSSENNPCDEMKSAVYTYDDMIASRNGWVNIFIPVVFAAFQEAHILNGLELPSIEAQSEIINELFGRFNISIRVSQNHIPNAENHIVEVPDYDIPTQKH